MKKIKSDRQSLHDLPKKPGFYQLLWGNKIVFIGTTEDLRLRLEEHKQKHRFGLVEYIVTETIEEAIELKNTMRK